MTIFETEFMAFNAAGNRLFNGVFTVVADCAEDAIKKTRQRIMDDNSHGSDGEELSSDLRVADITFMSSMFKLQVDIA